MTHGPLMLDLVGTTLSQEEREMLAHPAAGGVILFSRNYESPEQLTRLVTEIHQLRDPSLLVAVDQEGGRVQRFREGFTQLPPAGWYAGIHNQNPESALDITRAAGWLMARELRASGIDFSFAPVLDLDRGVSQVIGDRAFGASPTVVSELAHAWMMGMHDAGMAAVGKHFPGHGGVAADSHHELPVDQRRVEDIMMEDLLPFQRLIDAGLEAIMPAHVIYPLVVEKLAGFSSYWLMEVLRGQLGFQGAIFSDDLTMAAAGQAGDYPQRAKAALEAGCDMVLVCNSPVGAAQVLDELKNHRDPAAQMRLIRMHGRKAVTRDAMHLDPQWKRAVNYLVDYEENPALQFDF